MPFSVVYEPVAGSAAPQIVASMRNNAEWNNARIVTLDPGAWMVSMSWNGPGSARLEHRPIYQQATPGPAIAEATTVTTGVPVSSRMVTVSGKSKHHVSVLLATNATQAMVDAGYVATVTVFPVQRYGA